MSCSVAISSSPVFTPSRRCSPETLTLNPYHLHASNGSPSSAPSRSRLQRGSCGLRAFSMEASSPEAVESSPFPADSLRSGVGGASGLKRKRPARIDIPSGEAAAFSAAPAKSDGRREVEVESARFSVFCKRGRKRVEMEDRFKADQDAQMAFFGIFDGHGGPKAAEFASEKMGDLIKEEMVMEVGEGVPRLEEAVTAGYRKTDAGFLKEEINGGACCVTALLREGDLVVSNAGDCRAVLSRAGTAEALTADHRPSREDEKNRIESLGGYVDYCRGVWRLQGTLAVSRSIGDSHLKQWVIPDPETKILRIDPECEFLILASDGLWDKVGNQEAVDIARPFCTDPEKPSPVSACRKLAELSATRGSVDDISVMIIQLGHYIRA